MRVLSSQEFSIEPRTDNNSRIVLNGVRTRSAIAGSCLELSVATDDGYLVFLTDGIPWEDRLHIHLLDAELRLHDSASIGTIYSTGSFRDPVIESQHEISFNFIGGTRWVVELLGRKVFRLPLLSTPKGVWRKNAFHQYFKVHGRPEPETT